MEGVGWIDCYSREGVPCGVGVDGSACVGVGR